MRTIARDQAAWLSAADPWIVYGLSCVLLPCCCCRVPDFGWADASWHREKGYREVQTPHMQQLVRPAATPDGLLRSRQPAAAAANETVLGSAFFVRPGVRQVDTGIELEQNYVFKFCSPTRSAIQVPQPLLRRAARTLPRPRSAAHIAPPSE